MTRILLVDRQLVLEGLERLLRDEFSIAGVTSRAAVAPSLVRGLQPQIVLIESSLPDALEAVLRIQSEMAHVKVMLLSVQEDCSSVLAALDRAPAAVLTKSATSKQLIQTIREVAAPHISAATIGMSSSAFSLRAEFPLLSKRLTEVLVLVAKGQTYKEIASSLNISPKTVEFHKSRLMERLGVRTIAGLTRAAMQRGLLD